MFSHLEFHHPELYCCKPVAWKGLATLAHSFRSDSRGTIPLGECVSKESGSRDYLKLISV